MKNEKCDIKNSDLISFLKTLSRDKLNRIAKNLKIEDYHKLSKEGLIHKIRDLFPNEMWIVDVPKNSLTEFLIYLPDEIKGFITMLAEGDDRCGFGIWELKKLRKKYGKRVDQWIKILDSYGIIFKIKNKDAIYVIMPEDVWSGFANVVGVLKPPKNIRFENFLNDYLTKDYLQHICRIYGLKISGAKKELIRNIIGYGLTPKDVLSVMYFKDLVALSEKLHIYPWEEKNSKKINREILINDLSSHIIYKSTSKKVSKEKVLEVDMLEILIDLISYKFTPLLKWNSNESDIEKQLIAYLTGFFYGKGVDTNFISQYKLSSGGKIDIYENKNDIGIELKYNPSRASLRETVQRIREYRNDVSKIIIAIFYEEINYSDTKIFYEYKNILSEIPRTYVIIRKL